MLLIVAFLRAINGGKRRVKMADLKQHFTGMGLTGVKTFIASGNVVFDDPGGPRDALETRIEAGLLKSLGYEFDTFVRSVDDVAALTAPEGLAPVDKQTLRVGFLKGSPPATVLAGLQTDDDVLTIIGTEMFWLCRTNIRNSRITGAKLEWALGGPTTMRSMKTVNRMAVKFGH